MHLYVVPQVQRAPPAVVRTPEAPADVPAVVQPDASQHAVECPAAPHNTSSLVDRSEEQELYQQLHILAHELEVTREELEAALDRTSELGLALVASKRAVATKPSWAADAGSSRPSSASTPPTAPEPVSQATSKDAPSDLPPPAPQGLPSQPVLRPSPPLSCPWLLTPPQSEAPLLDNSTLSFAAISNPWHPPAE